MTRQLTPEDGKTALRDHVVQKAQDARERHCVQDGAAIVALLEDRAVVRYPVELRFDGAQLEPGEFAWPAPLGDHPSAGFRLFLHPFLQDRPEAWPLVVAYHLPSINYGEIVSHEEAELFGATLLGLEVDDYYERLCALADALPAAAD